MFGSSLGIGGSLIPLDERLVALASLAIVVLVLVLVLGSFCPLCQGQQRPSKSSSAAVDDDDDEGDGNLKQFCLGNIIYQLHERGKWAVQREGDGERERERVPAGRVLISRLPNNTSQRRTLQQVAG